MPEVSILVKAKDQASKVLGGVGKSVKGLSGVIGSLGIVGSLALGAVAAGAVKLAYDAAMLEPTQITFENLSESIDTTAESMLEKLRPATMGVVSDMEIMQAANKYLAMGLASTEDEAANLTEMSIKLGMAMGRGPTQAMEEFALMMANMSIPRLDTFGISASKVRERINELMQSTKGMTREMAFQQAVMEQGRIAMSKVGDISGTTAVKMAKVGVAVKEAKQIIGEALVPVLDAAAEGFLNVLERMREVRDEREKLTDETYEMVQSEEEFIAAMYDSLPLQIKQEVLASKSKKAVFDLAYATAYQTEKLERQTEAVRQAARVAGDWPIEVEHGTKAIYKQAEALEASKDDYEKWIDTLGRLKEAVREEMFPDESELREIGDILYQIYVEENPRVIAARQAYRAEKISGDQSLTIAQETADGVRGIYEDAQDRLEETRAGMHGVPGAYDVQAITSEAVGPYKEEWDKAQKAVEALEEGHMARMGQLEAGIVGAVNAATSPALEVYRTYLANVEEAERLAAIGRAEAWVESIGGVAPATKDILAEMVRDGDATLAQIPEGIREDVEESLLEFEWMALGYSENVALMLADSEEFEEVLRGAVTQGADAAEIQGLRMKKALVDEALEPAIETSEELRRELDELDGSRVDIYVHYHYIHHGEPGPEDGEEPPVETPLSYMLEGLSY